MPNGAIVFQVIFNKRPFVSSPTGLPPRLNHRGYPLPAM
jgi:hypothetical protein